MGYQLDSIIKKVGVSQQVLSIPLVLLLITIAVSSCANAQTPPPPPQDWQYRWLKKIPCSAPCWEGIRPGQTTASEAIELLDHSPLVKNVKNDPHFDRSSKLGDISWDWVADGSGGGALYTRDGSDTIISITPSFGVYYSIRDVIQAYGEPTHILTIAERAIPESSEICQRATFVYLPYGLELQTNCYPKLN